MPTLRNSKKTGLPFATIMTKVDTTTKGIHVKGEVIRLFIPEYLLEGFRKELKKRYRYEGDNIGCYILSAMADYIE